MRVCVHACARVCVEFLRFVKSDRHLRVSQAHDRTTASAFTFCPDTDRGLLTSIDHDMNNE